MDGFRGSVAESFPDPLPVVQIPHLEPAFSSIGIGAKSHRTIPILGDGRCFQNALAVFQIVQDLSALVPNLRFSILIADGLKVSVRGDRVGTHLLAAGIGRTVHIGDILSLGGEFAGAWRFHILNLLRVLQGVAANPVCIAE